MSSTTYQIVFVVWHLKPEWMEEACVHGHGPDDVYDAEDDGAVDGATRNAEAVHTADY